MKKLTLISFLIFTSCNQKPIEDFSEAEIVSTIKLPKEINETSGLEIVNNNFSLFTDSDLTPLIKTPSNTENKYSFLLIKDLITLFKFFK